MMTVTQFRREIFGKSGGAHSLVWLLALMAVVWAVQSAAAKSKEYRTKAVAPLPHSRAPAAHVVNRSFPSAKSLFGPSVPFHT